MAERSFLDSNVLIYTDDGSSPAKQRTALELIARCRRRRDGVVSLQVLEEYLAISTCKLGVDAAIAGRKVELFSELSIVATRVEDVLAAIDLHRLHQFSFWDALVIRSALQAGCSRLYSEDRQHGRRIDGVEIVNPFR